MENARELYRMNVFISWSGDRGQHVARTLRKWIPFVLQSVDPWMSDQEIEPGTRWANELARTLDAINFGIICLTPETIDTPWVLFEAGALSKALSDSIVCPYLIDLEPGQLKGPLNQFNAVLADKDGTLGLLRAMNRTNRKRQRLPEQILEETFEQWWPKIDADLKQTPDPPTTDSREKYWIGSGVDLDAIWQDFDHPPAMIENTRHNQLHMLRLNFTSPAGHLPLFSHEAVYKTVRGTYHEVAEVCLPASQRQSLAPLFLHGVRRGSTIFEFLGQLDPILTWAAAFGAAAVGYRALLSTDQQFDEARLAFIRKNFPNATPEDELAYISAWTTFGRRKVLRRLYEQGIASVEVSRNPLTPDTPTVETFVIDIGPAGSHQAAPPDG